MKNSLIAGLLALTVALGACAKEEKAAESAKPEAAPVAEKKAEATPAMDVNSPNVMKIALPTMQCESCAKTIKRAVKGVNGYEDATIDVDNKVAFIKVANNTPEAQMEMEKAIAKAGYSTPNVQRDQAAYDGLDECCKEDGMKK
ncbi:MAG: heavy-metal-associated domain-containing protein [Chlorobi bacterium]|nr:MAG: copper exporting ATPase [Chlorobi bacterium OLB7]MBK8910039.1 heavy-metal-associated domain-containing protein [Chlorobiota bacterium]MBX7217489.1 heavy-metal-associated domain-containing protein [Candidatus Kapabacteria bacterium]